MLAFLVIAVPAAVLYLLGRAARRRVTLAGLDSDRPVFQAEPPKRYSTSREDHRL